MPDCDLVLLGADSIGDAGVVNKIGSASLAEPAHRMGKPVYVISDETKILPPGFPQHIRDDRPADEVWRAPAGVRVWNRYFETIPMDWVTAVVTEVVDAGNQGDVLGEGDRQGALAPPLRTRSFLRLS